MIRKILKSSVSLCFINAPIKRHFSNIQNYKARIVKAFKEEYKHETDSYEFDDSIQKFIKEKGWTLEDDPNSAIIRLKKSVGNSDIIVQFVARSPPSQEEPQDEEANPEDGEMANEDNNEQQKWEDYCDFSVYITGEKTNLHVDLSSVDGELSINTMNLIDDIDAHMKITKELNFDNSKYVGPEFNNLDEKLQNSFIDYLNNLGVDESLGVFIEHLSLDKEQRLYMNWLKNVQEFFN